MSKLNLDRSEADFLNESIRYWEKEELIGKDVAGKLRDSYEVKSFDWRRLAQYSVWIALLCGIVSIASLIIDDNVIRWLEKLYDTPDIVISLVSGGLAVQLFYYGRKMEKSYPHRIFTNEATIFMGVLFTASCIAFLGRAIDNRSGHFSLLFLFSVLVYGLLAVKFNSKLIWVFALVSLGSWFGTETGYQTDWSYYFLGLNYPLRFVFFGALLVVVNFAITRIPPLEKFRSLTYIAGMFYLFISLWLLSIFGNFGTLEDWLKIKQGDIFYWGIVSAAVSISFILIGLKLKDEIAREFGITFLLINIYTRYFEYFWDRADKTIFFGILAVSFWLIGRKAERIWTVQLLKR